MRPWSDNHFDKLISWQDGVSIFLNLRIMAGISLGQFWLIFPYLVNFQSFTKLSYFFQSDFTLQHWIHDSIKTPSCVFPASSHMPHHHHPMSSLPLLFLGLTLSFPCHHVLGYSFIITELLWHQWQLHSIVVQESGHGKGSQGESWISLKTSSSPTNNSGHFAFEWLVSQQ